MTDCPHTHQTATLYTKSNQATCVRMQCDRCGAGLREKPKSGFNLQYLPNFDLGKFEQWNEREAAAPQREWAASKTIRDAAWWERYTQYLATDHWKTVSALVRRRDPLCQVCFEFSSQQAHHVSYASFNAHGLSFPVECAGVCDQCHDRLHAEDKP
jgi:5-methylcytosine-specific restriction endonuclease McrA